MKLINALKRVFAEPVNELNIPKIELYGKRELVMTGCTNIDELGENAVVLSSPDMSLELFGEHLQLLLLAKRTVAIRGKIDKIELKTGKNA